MRENWDDLRFVLAVAEEGSISGAARRLNVNHATVLRRIAAYEEAAGVALFDKTARGYSVPDAQLRVIEAAREVDRAVQAVGRMMQGAKAPLSGEVRVTSTDSFCQYVLPPLFARLRTGAPSLKIELLCSNAHLDLGRIHADITVRPVERLPDELVGDTPSSLGFSLFRSAERHRTDWLGVCGPLARSTVGKWLGENVPSDRIVACADSFLVLREMVAAGEGQAILPSFLGREDRRLELVSGDVPALSVRIWVACHTDLADIPRIAELRRALVRMLAAEAPRLEGPD